MNKKVEVLFQEGERLMEYGSGEMYPFNSSASLHWRLQGRRLLHLAHCIWVIQEGDEDVFTTVLDVLGGEYD